jgi:hypothetical protein
MPDIVSVLDFRSTTGFELVVEVAEQFMFLNSIFVQEQHVGNEH